jgi:DNA-binding transcriptional regulator GbsR (MarR family)
MGAIYGAVYLSPKPLTLDELVAQVGVTKGAVSTNIRNLERLNMVSKVVQVGDRKDYYEAETNFWQIIKGVLRERERSEFDRALRAVSESLEMVRGTKTTRSAEDASLEPFYEKRLCAMEAFFKTVDSVVAAILAVDDFRVSAFARVFRKL